MTAKDAIRSAMSFSSMIVEAYISDLSDDDLFLRPAPGMNHIAWQLGHLISSEQGLLSGAGLPATELPAGFREAHAHDVAGSDDRKGFGTKQSYLDTWKTVRTGTLSTLDKVPDADFAKPAPEAMRKYCATIGDLFVLIATHPMMHVGQWVPIRRKLNKPIVI